MIKANTSTASRIYSLPSVIKIGLNEPKKNGMSQLTRVFGFFVDESTLQYSLAWMKKTTLSFKGTSPLQALTHCRESSL